MPEPWEMTKNEALAYAAEIRDRVRTANREAAPLLREQTAAEGPESAAQGKEPWEMTKEEALACADDIREETRRANREAAPLIRAQLDPADG